MNDIDTFGAKVRGELFLAEGFLYGYQDFCKSQHEIQQNIVGDKCDKKIQVNLSQLFR